MTQVCLAQAFREPTLLWCCPLISPSWCLCLAGWLFFSELPGIWIWIGGTVVFSGVFLNAWFEAGAGRRRLRRAEKHPNSAKQGN